MALTGWRRFRCSSRLFILSLCSCHSAPFFTEFADQKLKPTLSGDDVEDSVHFLLFPVANSSLIDPAGECKLELLQSAVLVGRALRGTPKVPVRRPIAEFTIGAPPQISGQLEGVTEYISELNILKISFENNEKQFVRFSAISNSRALGKRRGKQRPGVKDALRLLRRPA